MNETSRSSQIRFGQVLRYARNRSPEIEKIDDVINFHHLTRQQAQPAIQLERGIQWPAPLKAPDGSRTPAILIASSQHKVGRNETPWEDIFDVDNGHIR